jgi:hypothetical protein
MRIVFRKFTAEQPSVPGPGEVVVKRNPAFDAAGPGLALLVLSNREKALCCGEGEPACLVVNAADLSPTLDEMLAASFAGCVLEGQDLPGGCVALARYAEHLLGGHVPAGAVEPEDSIEGIFHAIRNAKGTWGKEADLGVPEVGRRFLADWAKMEACLLQAATDKGFNPFATSPFTNHPDFAEERAYIAADRDKYLDDLRRGERWWVTPPTGRGRAAGLRLDRPESLLFWRWARKDKDAPGEAGYLFLAVDWGKLQEGDVGNAWVFSTDPERRVPIAPLADALQELEKERAPDRAARNPWYDGRRPEHAGTWVQSPRGGTSLTDAEVLRAVKKWAKVKRVREGGRSTVSAVGLALFAAALIAGVVIAWWLWRPPPMPDARFVEGEWNHQPIQLISTPLSGSLWQIDTINRALSGGEPLDAKGETTLEFEPREKAPWKSRLKVVLRPRYKAVLPAAPRVTVKVNKGQAELARRLTPVELGEAVFLSQEVEFQADRNYVTIKVGHPPGEQPKVDVRVQTVPQALHVLAVGVSKTPGFGELHSPARDIRGLKAVLEAQKGRLFSDVDVDELSENPAPTRQAIYEGLARLKKKATPFDVAVVLLSGHGELDEEKTSYFFAPSDYVRDNKGMRGLSGQELTRELAGLRCPVLLILSSCHSGGVLNEIQLPPRKSWLLIFAAARPEKEEKTFGGQGPLVLAVLEGLTNRTWNGEPVWTGAEAGGPARGGTSGPGSEPPALVTWPDLVHRVGQRMQSLPGTDAEFLSFAAPGASFAGIPLTLAPEWTPARGGPTK